MGEFKKRSGFGGNSRGGDRPHFGSRPNFDRGNRGERGEMFPATCDQCHKQCEVPFRPSGSKPVYCQDCFSSKREESGDFLRREDRSGGFQKRDFPAASKPVQDNRIEDIKRQLDAVNSKLDKLLQMSGGSVSQTKFDDQKPKTVAPLAEQDKKDSIVLKPTAKSGVHSKAGIVKKEAKKKSAAKKK